MTIATDTLELFQLPFMQRALIAGVLTGTMGGLIGSFTILRQLSSFSSALGHSALFGISLGVLIGVQPSVAVLMFAVIFAIAVTYFLEYTKLWTDALLNILHSSLLAIAIIMLSSIDRYKGGLNTLLFGDILATQTVDLIMSAVLLVLCVGFIGLTLRTQMMVTLHEPMAIARGISVSTHQRIFIVLLALVVGVSIKAIGVLLVSAFIVIPASAARLLSRKFTTHVLVSAGLGALSAIIGIIVSAFFNLPSGPSIVVAQFAIFILTVLMPKPVASAH
jgi:zinc/manganese transport system permease protein